ncbi:MAG: hypothetical protein IPP08_07360 [Chlorobiota bacterium]|jgi:hypothetical protein|nr:hypothetical protein [Chlorobiota bacterium]QQS65601.1 MAG: hypothetical protein IPP08_07360 [Chlorobiota bacterium]
MQIEELRIGMKIIHPTYGEGIVESLSRLTADVTFDFGRKIISPESSGITPATTMIEITSLKEPIELIISKTVDSIISRLGIEVESVSDLLLSRWENGKLIIQSSNLDLKPKEIDIEVFFHKIVMMRNNLRVLEQKINSHDKFSESEKIELQSYITRCYGSLTTFNILFRNQSDHF